MARRRFACTLWLVTPLACGADAGGSGASQSSSGVDAETSASSTANGSGLTAATQADATIAGSAASSGDTSSGDPPADETDVSSCPDVHVGDLIVDETTDLDALRFIRRVEGALIVEHTAASSLEFLECLRVVEGSMLIRSNADLVALDGLQGVTSIGVRLTIAGNPALTSLGALEQLTSVEYLDVRSNSALQEIDLPQLQEIGELQLGVCDIEFEPGLDNPQLQSLDGLSGLTSLGFARIGSQSALTSIARLHELAAAGGLELAEFNHNPSLPYDDILSLADLLGSDKVWNTCGNLGEPENHECICDMPD